jgi:hypothetical protein
MTSAMDVSDKVKESISSKEESNDCIHDSGKDSDQESNSFETSKANSFQLGDHVYKWCPFAGIPGLLQRDGIIIEIKEEAVVIVDCDDIIRREESPHRTLLVLKNNRGVIRIIEKDNNREWRKVVYSASWWKRNIGRSGTCTATPSDPPGLVLSRVTFLLTHSEALPQYHFLKANCECVAVWCKTGNWATLQTSSLLNVAAAGQAKSTTTLAAYAASQQVTVPTSGFWGYLGYTTKVSLFSMQPYLLPAIAGYGVITVGGPMWMLYRCKKFWNATTVQLQNEFWESAIDQPDEFAKSITEWSQL